MALEEQIIAWSKERPTRGFRSLELPTLPEPNSAKSY